jgi:hypothetical protein
MFFNMGVVYVFLWLESLLPPNIYQMLGGRYGHLDMFLVL